MRRFAELFVAIDQTTKTTEKVAAMAQYFRQSEPLEAAWALYFLYGRKPRQVVSSRSLRIWCCEAAGIPAWLFDECYQVVGDLAETIALLLPPTDQASDLSLPQCVETLSSIGRMPEEDRKRHVLRVWMELEPIARFLWNKLITGNFRVGVSQSLVVRALSDVSGLSPQVITHRLMGEWSPTADFFLQLLSTDDSATQISRPYPFFLAYPLEQPVSKLGLPRDWQVEWKWDGIRAQLVRRGNVCHLWSRGEELLTDRFPEVITVGQRLPDGTVLDGELLPWKEGHVLPFTELQRRIGRKRVTKKILTDVPVILIAYDLLELSSSDYRNQPLWKRRQALEQVLGKLSDPRIRLSERLLFASWDELTVLRQQSRQRSVEGLMLKRLDSTYQTGRVRGDWWKWKVDPLTVDAVLTAAQRGHGRRAGLYTDYTFAVWDEAGQLIPITKAYSGLTDSEIKQVDAFIRANTLERFGPVRSVKPLLVFELGFEGIQRSTRHKSGIALRFPRILRIRTDKRPEEADTLHRVQSMLTIPPETGLFATCFTSCYESST